MMTMIMMNMSKVEWAKLSQLKWNDWNLKSDCKLDEEHLFHGIDAAFAVELMTCNWLLLFNGPPKKS